MTTLGETDRLATFARSFEGETVLPGDDEYDTARAVWNGSFDRRPALIARCRSADDIAAVIRLARDTGLPLAVRGGGHSLAGLSSIDDGIVLDLSRMREVGVDPAGRTARVQPGATWGVFDAATQEHGLASTGGLISTTGVAGLTLGGGIGWLMRQHGLACDNLISADVATASGEVVRTSSASEPELLWGLRGGGGNFGVVTSFEFRLQRVGPVVGGLALFPIERGHDVLRMYREWSADLPDAFTTLAGVVTAPPAPFVPPDIVGTKVVALLGCWCGASDRGLEILEPVRAMTPVADAFGPISYTALQGMLDAGAPPGQRNYVRSGYVADLSGGLIDTVLDHGSRMPSPFSQIHFHQMGGAVARVGEQDTAFGNRRAAFAFNLISTWTDPAEDDLHERANRELMEAVVPFSTGGVYVNFLANEGEARVRAAYGHAAYERLAALKRSYDPGNLFRMNQNIPPAA
jgi:FAD/FMN-containing dehydrogenase